IDDSFNVSPLISQSFSDLAGYISFFLVVIFIMFKLSIWLLLFSILLLGIYFIGYKIYSSRMNEVANLKQKTFSIYTKELEEGLNLTYDIRVHGILDRAIKRLTSSLDEFFKKYFDFLALNLKYQGILTNGILAVSKIGVICIGIIFIMKNILTVGDLVAFVSYTGYLYEFLSFLVTFNITVEPAFVSLNRLKETLELEEVYIIRPHSVELPISQNYPYAVEIKNLNFGYNNTNLLFRDFNLKIKNRSITGIYGKSGCGKTTLLNLFLKLYKVNKGEIFVFGKDINDYSLYEIHKIFTVVEQEPKFFSDTVWENFRIFLGDNKEKEIKEIASMLGMGGLIENLTSREVGAKLSDLSGGERKRLGILRSLLVPNPIILMDEPTSFLDKESARIIFENLVKNFKNKTIIIFSHDPFVKQFCEDVIELESLKEK
ncbi:MAG: ABC transporter ATP-binding protein, partial [candidate division WOR-3 bacterium]